MPIVFVHGVPETDAIWDPLVAELGRDDVIRLSPPGFGAPVPDGFEPVRKAYVDWLGRELQGIDGPIDLVGHDWGAGHVIGLMATRPESVRSWAIDVAGIAHRDYVWHDVAQLWRTPEVGEQVVDAMMTPPVEARATNMENLGMPSAVARALAEAQGETMGRCILSLYRSADPNGAGDSIWDDLPKARARPGLVLIPTEDHYAGPLENSEAVAERCGAATVRLEGHGHWWMLSGPTEAAAALNRFWSGF